jgi:uncharacterized damage-inducible protein DinB
MVRVEQVLESWKLARQFAIEAVLEFPPGEFDFRPCAEMMTFGETARHILEAGDGLAGMLAAGEEDFTGPDFRAKLAATMRTVPAGAGASELATAMQASVEERTAALVGRSPEFWAHIVTRFDGVAVTRLEMLQTVKEHELTHRQQLFFCLRLKGIVPSTTRRRLARQAAK